MAQKLVSYYEKAKEIGGLKAQMRMAVITKFPSSQAQALPDSDEYIQIFEAALNEIKKEYK